MKTITITIHDDRRYMFDVACDGKTTGDDGSLGFDEMLGLIAALTIPSERRNLQWLKTPEQHAAEKQRREQMARQREAETGTPHIPLKD